MIKTFIATLALATLATPALAADPETPAAAPVASVPAGGAAAGKTKFCIVETFTGSRIPKRMCKTRAEWLETGVDITAK